MRIIKSETNPLLKKLIEFTTESIAEAQLALRLQLDRIVDFIEYLFVKFK